VLVGGGHESEERISHEDLLGDESCSGEEKTYSGESGSWEG
jgi:hypothetical protein